MVKQESGYIALITVLIVGAIATAICLALLLTGTDSQRTALISQQAEQARGLAISCAQEGLQQIHDSSSYTGTSSLTLGQGSCTYTVTNTGGSNRTITTNGTVGSVVKKLQLYVTIGASSISVTSWQETT